MTGSAGYITSSPGEGHHYRGVITIFCLSVLICRSELDAEPCLIVNVRVNRWRCLHIQQVLCVLKQEIKLTSNICRTMKRLSVTRLGDAMSLVRTSGR